MDGSGKATAHRRWLWDAGEAYDNSGNYFRTREETIARHVETFIGTQTPCMWWTLNPHVGCS